ncbi:SemiSWEET transporter [Fusibacter ferrireducens]|uniref:SemiSWEET family sugar transporter n=1 Tax=Fusibacter ferrireducens TaxID=2785058 RepID=A0ABR9ZXW0_9FIRM|nr:SemiSWEET transporter [Fusibacter ferrireducens]MBF4695303.1 SemiSWEET family sugar transporter [Fusibacter ferrireducens]
MTTVIGLVAAFLSTISFLPQAIKVVTTKKTDGISLVMYAIFTMGVLLWALYGFMTMQLPVIIANVITLVFAVIILFYTWQNVMKEKRRTK